VYVKAPIAEYSRRAYSYKIASFLFIGTRNIMQRHHA